MGHDLPRRLRAHAARRGAAARLHPLVHDLRPGRRAAARQALPRRARGGPQALHAGVRPGPDLGCQEPAPRRRRVRAHGGLVLRADRRGRVSPVRARAPPNERDGLRRPAGARRQRARAIPRSSRAVHHGAPACAGRRVPGHQSRPVPLAAAAGGGAQEPGGGRRPRSVDLPVPWSRHPQHPGVRGRLPRRVRCPARAELPLDTDDPRRRERSDRQQPRPEIQVAVV